MRAIDTDIGSNGAIRYRIRKDPLGNYKTFHIDSKTGKITLQKTNFRILGLTLKLCSSYFSLGHSKISNVFNKMPHSYQAPFGNPI